MKITSLILALSAVVALTQAQLNAPVPSVNGAVEKVKPALDGVQSQVDEALKSVTGILPATLRRRQDLNNVVTGAQDTASQTLNAVTGLVSAPVKRQLPTTELPQVPTTEIPNLLEYVQKIPELQKLVQATLENEIKKALHEIEGKVVVVVGLKAKIATIVAAAVDAEIASLITKVVGLDQAHLLATVEAAYEHCVAVIIPKVNEVLQSNEVTKDITLEAPKIADASLEKLLPKISGIINGLKPKVDDVVKNVKDKVQTPEVPQI
ncbi:hypothetical protein BGZ68_004725 [Mortierella alpina]|nr:hypothetical protein BGZ68_004725 [Mortierella alpina]